MNKINEMTTFTQPLYLPNIRWQRFFLYVAVAAILCGFWALPFTLYLICLQVAFGCMVMAVYQIGEWRRLTAFDDYGFNEEGFIYRNRGHEYQVLFTDVDITFLYYSSLDKMKGSATLGIRLKSGQTYRFCGVREVDKLLPFFKG